MPQRRFSTLNDWKKKITRKFKHSRSTVKRDLIQFSMSVDQSALYMTWKWPARTRTWNLNYRNAYELSNPSSFPLKTFSTEQIWKSSPSKVSVPLALSSKATIFQKCDIQKWNFTEMWHWKDEMYQKCNIHNMKHFSETWHSKYEMFQKYEIQNMKCLKNVTLKTWNVSEMWCSKYEMFQKCDIDNMKYFKNATLKIWNVSKMWRSKHKMFRKCDVQNIKCFGNVTFITWNISEIWHSK